MGLLSNVQLEAQLKGASPLVRELENIDRNSPSSALEAASVRLRPYISVDARWRSASRNK